MRARFGVEMKRTSISGAFLLAAMAAASAQERVDINGMACAEVQAVLKKDGTAILRYRSTFNLSLPRYDRYVAGQKNCAPGEIASRTGVPSTDKEYCPVYKCVESDIFVAR
jgi:hypothetical protein